MMKETINLDLYEEILADVDVQFSDSYVGVTTNGRVIFPFYKIELRKAFEFPLIRQLTNESFLVAEARVKGNADNCFIYDLEGNIIMKFFAGDGIADIVVSSKKIVITYFDEGVYGNYGPNNGGLVIFDFNGKILLNYNEKHGEQIISDCYCICKHGANRILFLPYTEFPLIELNIDTGEERRFKIPDILKGTSAVTSSLDGIFFFSPIEDKGGIYHWKTGEKNASKVGEHGSRLRGLNNGRFLSIDQKSFSILDLIPGNS